MARRSSTKRPRQGRKSFAPGFRVKGITAPALHRHIEQLEAQNGHKATAEEMLDSARPSTSPIHHLFEWDDKKAAEEHRLDKARYLLRAVLVEYYIEATKKTVTVRAHVFSPKKKAYFSIKTVLNDTEMRAELVRQALEELRAWQKTYRALHELASIFQAIDGLKF